MVTRLIKENELANVLEEPEDGIVVIDVLKGVLDCCKHLG